MTDIPTDIDRLQEALNAFAQAGGVVLFDICCETHARAGIQALPMEQPVAIVYRDALNIAFPIAGGTIKAPLPLVFRGNTRILCEHIEKTGLRAEVDPRAAHQINVLSIGPMPGESIN